MGVRKLKEKRMKATLLLVILLLVWMNATVARNEEAVDDTFRDLWDRIDGSSATLPLSEAIVMECLDIDSREAALRIQHHKTHAAYRALLEGDSDLIFVPKPEPGELETLWAQALQQGGMSGDMPALTYVPVVREGLVFLAHTGNPVENLTRAQLRGIYAGELTDWRVVGGPEGPIIPLQRSQDSGSQAAFLRLVMEGAEPAAAESALTHSGVNALAAAIAGQGQRESALGYALHYAVGKACGLEHIRLLSVDGIAPSEETILDGSYPLTTHYCAVYREDLPETHPARQMVEWLRSPEGQQVAREAGYVPLGEGA